VVLNASEKREPAPSPYGRSQVNNLRYMIC
jgi:hypothetical protein